MPKKKDKGKNRSERELKDSKRATLGKIDSSSLTVDEEHATMPLMTSETNETKDKEDSGKKLKKKKTDQRSKKIKIKIFRKRKNEVKSKGIEDQPPAKNSIDIGAPASEANRSEKELKDNKGGARLGKNDSRSLTVDEEHSVMQVMTSETNETTNKEDSGKKLKKKKNDQKSMASKINIFRKRKNEVKRKGIEDQPPAKNSIDIGAFALEASRSERELKHIKGGARLGKNDSRSLTVDEEHSVMPLMTSETNETKDKEDSGKKLKKKKTDQRSLECKINIFRKRKNKAKSKVIEDQAPAKKTIDIRDLALEVKEVEGIIRNNVMVEVDRRSRTLADLVEKAEELDKLADEYKNNTTKVRQKFQCAECCPCCSCCFGIFHRLCHREKRSRRGGEIKRKKVEESDGEQQVHISRDR